MKKDNVMEAVGINWLHENGFYGINHVPQVAELKKIFAGGYSLGVQFAANEIHAWMDLLIIAHKSISDSNGYSNQDEADREHANELRMLDAIRSKLVVEVMSGTI